jgi:hypothetical protein
MGLPVSDEIKLRKYFNHKILWEHIPAYAINIERKNNKKEKQMLYTHGPQGKYSPADPIIITVAGLGLALSLYGLAQGLHPFFSSTSATAPIATTGSPSRASAAERPQIKFTVSGGHQPGD